MLTGIRTQRLFGMLSSSRNKGVNLDDASIEHYQSGYTFTSQHQSGFTLTSVTLCLGLDYGQSFSDRKHSLTLSAESLRKNFLLSY